MYVPADLYVLLKMFKPCDASTHNWTGISFWPPFCCRPLPSSPPPPTSPLPKHVFTPLHDMWAICKCNLHLFARCCHIFVRSFVFVSGCFFVVVCVFVCSQCCWWWGIGHSFYDLEVSVSFCWRFVAGRVRKLLGKTRAGCFWMLLTVCLW